jgi:hypothetical protein
VSSAATGSYTVRETAEQQRERELRRLREVAARLSAQRAELVGRIQVARSVYGVEVDMPGNVPTVSAVREPTAYGALLDEVRAALDSSERAVDARVGEARIQALRSSVIGGLRERTESAISGEATLADQRAARQHMPNVEAQGEDLGAATEDALRVAGRLNARAPHAVAEAIQGLIEAIAHESNPSVARRTVDAIRHDVQTANEEAELAAARRAELDELAVRVGGSPGPRTDELARAVKALERSAAPITAAFRAEVESAVAAAEAEAKRTYVLDALQGSLRELGYEVGPEFETRLAERGFADAGRPASPGYAVRVRHVRGAEGLRFTVVRGPGRTQEDRDRAVEQAWCSDLRTVIDRLGTRGVEMDLTEEISPGTMPTMVSEELPAVRSADQGRAGRARMERADEL